ncbi:Protease 3 precursor [Mariniblastus fucicola]|uniref:Protease 3 n=2 Tax=Mariniblastus fucicola TaxID=980251 RepID=A0A5B9P474_9BACT|nr:Protease 3 precursor [Mariniblastus fucicola]
MLVSYQGSTLHQDLAVLFQVIVGSEAMLTTPQTGWTRLDNGVRVVTERVQNSVSTGISVLVDAGPQDEADGKLGLAHLCEHAAFLGTPLRTSRELARMIDAAGGCFGAFTAPDYTCYYSHVLDEYASYAMDLLGDILVASKYPEEALEREKDVICQEIIGGQDSPDERLLELTKKNLWPEDTLSNSLIGSEEDVRALDRSDVVQFVSRQYTPDRIIVAAAGSVEHDSIVEQVQDAFWPLRGQSSPRPMDPPVVRGGVAIEAMPTSHCNFAIAVPTPGFADERRYVLHVMNNLIGGGMSSRLFQSLREEHGLVYSVQSSILSYRRGGALVVTGATSSDQLIKAVNLVMMQLISLAMGEPAVDEEELWKSKMQVRSQSRLATDMVSNRVSRIATQEFHLQTRIEDEKILEAIDSVTIEAVQEMAIEILLGGMGRLSLVAVGPLERDGPIYSELNNIYGSFSALEA